MLILILISILLIAGGVFSHYIYKKYVIALKTRIIGYGDMIENVNMKLTSLELYQNLSFEIFENIISTPSNKLDKKYLLRKISETISENSSNMIEVAKANFELAKIYHEEKDDFRAIRELSNSLEIYEINEARALLNKIIFGSKTLERESASEEDLLKIIAESKDKDIKLKANYRLALMKSSINYLSQNKTKSDLKEAMDYYLFAKNNSGLNRCEINVALIFDENYSNYAATTILSILLSSDINTYYNFYAISDPDFPLSNRTMSSLEKICSKFDSKIFFKKFPAEIIDQNKEMFSICKGPYPRIVMFKAVLENILPDLDKIIVLDVDLLVLRDLSKIYNIDLGENYALSAVKTPRSLSESVMRFKTCKGLSSNYFSSGVMVYNLEKMREINNTSMLNSIIDTKSSDYFFPEMDNLNQLYKDKVKFMPANWNLVLFDNVELLHHTWFSPYIIHYANKPFCEKYRKMKEKGIEYHPYLRAYFPYFELAKDLMNGE